VGEVSDEVRCVVVSPSGARGADAFAKPRCDRVGVDDLAPSPLVERELDLGNRPEHEESRFPQHSGATTQRPLGDRVGIGPLAERETRFCGDTIDEPSMKGIDGPRLGLGQQRVRAFVIPSVPSL